MLEEGGGRLISSGHAVLALCRRRLRAAFRIDIFKQAATLGGLGRRDSFAHLLLCVDEGKTTFVENKLDTRHRLAHLAFNILRTE